MGSQVASFSLRYAFPTSPPVISLAPQLQFVKEKGREGLGTQVVPNAPYWARPPAAGPRTLDVIFAILAKCALSLGSDIIILHDMDVFIKQVEKSTIFFSNTGPTEH